MEVRYFAVDQWNTTTTSATTSGDQLVINTAIPVFTLAGTFVDANASSRLHSFELNGRRRVGDYLTVLAGVRYLEVDEHLGSTMTNSIVPFTYDAVARNRLYGAQIGGDVTLWDRGGPLSVSGVGKAGVYGNRAGQDSTSTTGLVTLPSSGGTSGAWRTPTATSESARSRYASSIASGRARTTTRATWATAASRCAHGMSTDSARTTLLATSVRAT